MYEWRIVDGVLVGTGDYLFGGGSERLSINETGEVNDFSVGMSRLLRFSEAASIARCDCELKMIES